MLKAEVPPNMQGNVVEYGNFHLNNLKLLEIFCQKNSSSFPEFVLFNYSVHNISAFMFFADARIDVYLMNLCCNLNFYAISSIA